MVYDINVYIYINISYDISNNILLHSKWKTFRQVVDNLLPQIRRQLRRLIKSPRPRPPEICRNSNKAGDGEVVELSWCK